MDIDWPVIEKQLILWADEIPDKYRYLIQQRCLGASSFSKGGGDVSNAGKTAHFKCAIFLTVWLWRRIKGGFDTASLSPSKQSRQLVFGPLSNLQREACQSYIVVIDAPDEPEDDKNVGNIGTDWPGETVLRQLVLHVSGLFIWVATSCLLHLWGEGDLHAREWTYFSMLITALLPQQRRTSMRCTSLSSSIQPPRIIQRRQRKGIRQVIAHAWKCGSGVILTCFYLFAKQAIALSVMTWTKHLRFLIRSLFDIPKDPNYPLRLHHPFFLDFLLNKDRCGDFWMLHREAHQTLALAALNSCPRHSRRTFARCMHVAVNPVERTWIENCVPPEAQYACLH